MYPKETKRYCLHLYVEENGFRRRERLTGVNHNTVINWVKSAANNLSSSPDYQEITEVAQIDELQTYVGQKAPRPRVGDRRKVLLSLTKSNLGLDGCQQESAGNFSMGSWRPFFRNKPLWKIVKGWKCFFILLMVM